MHARTECQREHPLGVPSELQRHIRARFGASRVHPYHWHAFRIRRGTAGRCAVDAVPTHQHEQKAAADRIDMWLCLHATAMCGACSLLNQSSRSSLDPTEPTMRSGPFSASSQRPRRGSHTRRPPGSGKGAATFFVYSSHNRVCCELVYGVCPRADFRLLP